MNNSKNTLEARMKIDQEIAEMKNHPIDYSDIPQRKPGGAVRLAHKEFLDKLPPDLVREMARRRLKELKDAGYIPENVTWFVPVTSALTHKGRTSGPT